MARGIDLRDFQIELRHPESGRTIKSEGGLVGLMERRGRWHDAEIAEYYAARGKLADLDCKRWGDSARQGMLKRVTTR